jgi:hypothetical protein
MARWVMGSRKFHEEEKASWEALSLAWILDTYSRQYDKGTGGPGRKMQSQRASLWKLVTPECHQIHVLEGRGGKM